MARICHGQGDPDNEGCCWVDGAICRHRVTRDGIWLCGIADRLIHDRPELARDRAALNAAWDNDSDYLRDVKPHWPEGTDCSTWGPGSGQCCFGESPNDNARKAARLSVVAITVRKAGGE